MLPFAQFGLHLFTYPEDIIGFIILLVFISARSALTWRLTRPLLCEDEGGGKWRRTARYMALLPPINLLLMIMLGLTLYYIIQPAAFTTAGWTPAALTARSTFESQTATAYVPSTQISFAIGGLPLVPLLLYVSQLARRTGHLGNGLGRLAFVSAFIVPLPALITLLVLLPIALTHVFFPGTPPAWATVRGVKTILGTPIYFAGSLATAWTSIILWLLASRISRLAKRAAKERDWHTSYTPASSA